jgi:hypothetical protein
MPYFVYDVPLKVLAASFILIAIAVMFISLRLLKPLLRRLAGPDSDDFNESVRTATTGFSLFYGLLLGLLTVAAYQNNVRVKEGILNEATTLSALYSDMTSYPEPIRSDMKAMLRDYVLFTVDKDWPAHQQGEFLNGGFNRANAMQQRLAKFDPATDSQRILHGQVMSAFGFFTAARQQRLTGVITAIPAVLWYAVLVGAAIHLLLLVMLHMPPRRQFVLGTINASFLGVVLFVIVALDNPLRGESGLSPAPLQLLWQRVMVWDEPQPPG